MATDGFIRQSDIEQNRVQSFAFVIAAGATVCFSICFAVNGLAGQGQSSQIWLESRINPNEAPVASLVRIPGIGTVRTAAMVAYRENLGSADNPAFRDCDDLQKVHGIGPKTAQNICQWLRFE
ncbi:MAG: ComEA family DNA-binding protein [Planctomycetota bacterium]|jgi:DNA uptake protein ComE-like DNA-binding protein